MEQPERRKHFRNYLHPHKRVEVELSSQQGIVEFSRDKRIQVELASPNRKEPLPGVIVNISLGGMLLWLEESDTQLKKGDQFVASFSLPDGAGRLELECEVANVQGLRDGKPSFGFSWSCDAQQEKILWRFLTEEQRRQNQLLLENARMERQKLNRLITFLRGLLPLHAAVARAQTKGLDIFLTVVIGLAGGGLVALALSLVNQGIWDNLAVTHGVPEYSKGPPDYEALVPPEKLSFSATATPQEIAAQRKQAAEKREEEIRRRQEEYQQRIQPVQDEYNRLKTSVALIGAFAIAVGIVLSAALLIYFQHRRPRVLARARQNVDTRIQEFAQKNPEDLESWGGPSALDSAAKVEGLLDTLEDKITMLLAAVSKASDSST